MYEDYGDYSDYGDYGDYSEYGDMGAFESVDDYGMTSEEYDAVAGAAGGLFLGIMLVFLVVCIIQLVAQWKIFEKAGRPGWHAIIPVYNMWSFFEIVGMSGWFCLMSFIPAVGPLVYMIFYIMFLFKLSTAFGKDTGFGFGLLFLGPIFFPILGFSKNTVYVGNVNTNAQANNVQANPYGNPYVDSMPNQMPNQMGNPTGTTMNQGYTNPTQTNMGPQDSNNNGNMPL